MRNPNHTIGSALWMGKPAEKRFFPSIKRGNFIIDRKSECKVTNKNEEFSTCIRL